MKHIPMSSRLGAFALSVAMMLVGCGGGGGASTGTVPGGSSLVHAYISDDVTVKYDQVWVTFYRVSLVASDGTKVELMSDPAGIAIDLRSLTDGVNPIYRWLSSASVPEKTYTGFEVSVQKNVLVHEKGAAASQTVTIGTSFNDPSDPTRALISSTFRTPKTFRANENFHIDFPLKQWVVTGSALVPKAESGNGQGLDDKNKHEEFVRVGITSQVTGTIPNRTFTLTPFEGKRNPVKVFMDANTVLMNADGSANPQLNNDKVAVVTGVFDPAIRSVAAKKVLIRTGLSGDPVLPKDQRRIEGTPEAVNEAGSTFNVAITKLIGLVPTSRTVKVVTTANTRLLSDGGVPIPSPTFYAALATSKVEVEGAYDAGTNTLTARTAKLDDNDDGFNQVEAKGLTTSFVSGASVTIRLSEWAGFEGQLTKNLTISTATTSRFEDANGDSITSAQFYAALAVDSPVQAEGDINATGELAATKVRLRKKIGGGGGGGGGLEDNAFMVGTLKNITTDGVTLVLTRWGGFAGSFGSVFSGDFTSSTRFLGKRNQELTKEQFIQLVNSGNYSLEVEGNYALRVFTVFKIKIDD